MRAVLLGIIVGIASTALTAHADEVYKWVDKDGTVHYGEFPPNNKKSKTIETPSTPEPQAQETSEESDATAPPAQAAPTDAPKANSRDKFLEDRNKQKEEKEKAERLKKEKLRACNEAKSNVEMLGSGGKIRIVDESGNAKFLNEEEMKKRLDAEKKNVEKYCKK